jgi:hypothetical protein
MDLDEDMDRMNNIYTATYMVFDTYYNYINIMDCFQNIHNHMVIVYNPENIHNYYL